jgi:hypothetical protein
MGDAMAGAVDEFAVQVAGGRAAAHGVPGAVRATGRGAACGRALGDQLAEGKGGAEKEY